ncbi:hypothetical protein RYH80_04585 [Halobaculum sp. MBLA0147]|uniref:hypothetical protein n=1 Tax=Halobaculum sp. MBLA0147 TaxID=3079934 RepID=UPI003523197D
MVDTDEPITEVDEELLDESADDADDTLPDEVVLFAVTGLMAVATAGVFLVGSIPNGSAVMPITIGIGTLGLGVRARLRES